MKITKLDLAVAIIAGLTCFGLLIKIPVWALFFGWAWYFALGANPSAFRQSIPSMILGYLLAGIAIVAYTASGYNIFVMVAIVGLTVFGIMLSLKIKAFACSLASFNAYSCLFAGYYAKNFPVLENSTKWDINNVLVAIGWIAMANVLGLICGYLSVKIGSLGTKKQLTNSD